MSDNHSAPHVRYVPGVLQKTPNSRKLARILFVVVWVMILLIPGFFIWIGVNGEFSVLLGDAPEQKLRVWLVSEIRERGFGISTGGVASRNETDVCVQTDLRYLLWQGSQDPIAYCECFTRTSPNESWSYSAGWDGDCTETPQEPQS